MSGPLSHLVPRRESTDVIVPSYRSVILCRERGEALGKSLAPGEEACGPGRMTDLIGASSDERGGGVCLALGCRHDSPDALQR